ncbi:MAG: GNAT family N-acetyltransferase [Anaerolineales bacterium]|nr:GNAT family N-acetyltransferase [Anaerolineales bacterium]
MDTAEDTLRTIEELSLNAWPAFQTNLLDGWILRFADGYTRRANSVLPLYPGSGDPGKKIRTCEQAYRNRNLPTTFKLPGSRTGQELDRLLSARGYRSEAPTSTQMLDLSAFAGSDPAESPLAGPPPAAWQAAFDRLTSMPPPQQQAHVRLLDLILPAKRLASLTINSRIVACGLGVLQDGYLGLFDIIVDPEYRRKGYGKQIVQDLLGWGKGAGAHTAYLNVMLDNTPALRLYDQLGFREIYRYWYRILL